MHEAL